MLELRNIKKSYTTGTFTQVALNGISLNFRKNEFVAILGASGSGKTTCLNVIGGLDQYDSGDLIINGTSTKEFKDRDWDAYRNNSVGFIFQSYNLIPHLNIVDNVEMGMTLSGVSSKIKHQKAEEALCKVGLKEHMHKRPNQLSGGQMQRVAIARALANDPDIILADEPTGALDSTTSEQIMELIKEIADNKLVIMVTHNPELAEHYADRIVRFKDGNIVDDSNPCDIITKDQDYTLKKTSMSFLTALKLSGKNIAMKKWRTALTAFAASIGIIGIALILSLSSGFQIQIDKFQQDALAEFPIIVSQSTMSMDQETMAAMQEQREISDTNKFAATDKVTLYDPNASQILHTNIMSEDYVNYVNEIDPVICNSIGYTRLVGMNLLRDSEDGLVPVSISSGTGNDAQSMANMTSMSGIGLSSYPVTLDGDPANSYLEKNYDVMAGTYPSTKEDLVLVIDEQNRLDVHILENLGFDTTDIESMAFSDLVGMEFKLIQNNDYYEKTAFGTYMPSNDYERMATSEHTKTLRISGILRVKEDVAIGILSPGIAYSDDLVTDIIAQEKNSDIVKAQEISNLNVFTMEQMDASTKTSMLSYLGGDATPFMMYLYPNNFESKDQVTSYLDAYNVGKDKDDQIIYNDLAATMTSMTGGIMSAITMVLVAFASISLVVSLIMIEIITYISVLERTKEIGVLRALGARKKDITRVFNAETFIIGACSGCLGILIAYALTFPINAVLFRMTELEHVAQLNPIHALLLVTISVILTLIGGAIPARFAAKKDPVEALRSE